MESFEKPIKLWLAKTGYERLQEMANPERSLYRVRENWKKYGQNCGYGSELFAAAAK